MRHLKAQLGGEGGAVSADSGDAQPQQVQSNGQMGTPNGSQSNGHMNSQMGFMAPSSGQMQMGQQQQYGNMVSPNGSQAYFTNMPNVVLVASPTNMQPMQPMQMQQMQPVQMMSPSGQMQQMQPMPFMNQSQDVGAWNPNTAGAQPVGTNEIKATGNLQEPAMKVVAEADPKGAQAQRIEEE